mgnify:CR=1 FL=1
MGSSSGGDASNHSHRRGSVGGRSGRRQGVGGSLSLAAEGCLQLKEGAQQQQLPHVTALAGNRAGTLLQNRCHWQLAAAGIVRCSNERARGSWGPHSP